MTTLVDAPTFILATEVWIPGPSGDVLLRSDGLYGPLKSFGANAEEHGFAPGEGLPGPGIGLIIGWIAVLLLAFHWARVVWSRTAVQLAAEEERRRAVAARQHKTLLDDLDPEAGPDPDKP